MKLEAYIFSHIPRKLNQTYYSVFEDLVNRNLYLNLKDYPNDGMELNTFIYKVTVNTNEIYYIDTNKVKAVKYKIVAEVPIVEFVKESLFSKKVKNELLPIFRGAISEEKVMNIYNKIITKDYWRLNVIESLKLHAILSQKIYKLPSLKANTQHTHLAKLFSFYDREQEIDKNDMSLKHWIEREFLFGSKQFENTSEEYLNELLEKEIIGTCFTLVRLRKVTQNQFETILNSTKDKGYKRILIQYALLADYDIPQEFQIKYPLELVFKYPNLVSSLSDSQISNIPSANHLLMIGYKIKDWNYDYFDAREIMRAREIFKNDTYQVIEPGK